MPISALKHIPEDVRKEYYSLLLSANAIKKNLSSIDEKYNEQIEQLKKKWNSEKNQALQKLDKLEKAMNVLHPKDTSVYDKNTGWKEKVIWVLNEANRVLPVSSIVAKIRMYENDFDKALSPIIRLTMKRMEDKDEIVKFNEPNPGAIHYGLPHWFEDGKLIDSYHYLL